MSVAEQLRQYKEEFARINKKKSLSADDIKRIKFIEKWLVAHINDYKKHHPPMSGVAG